MRGGKSLEKDITRILPPCRVCGEPGTGLHYGVTTCGACKGFFRRSCARKEPYECTVSFLCDVGPGTVRRHTCPKCRFEKCLAVGMSKDAIQMGRYSIDKKTKDFEEVMSSIQPLNFTSIPSAHGNGTTADVSKIATPVERVAFQKKHVNQQP